jgi:predicted transcriptional regulator
VLYRRRCSATKLLLRESQASKILLLLGLTCAAVLKYLQGIHSDLLTSIHDFHNGIITFVANVLVTCDEVRRERAHKE